MNQMQINTMMQMYEQILLGLRALQLQVESPFKKNLYSTLWICRALIRAPATLE